MVQVYDENYKQPDFTLTTSGDGSSGHYESANEFKFVAPTEEHKWQLCPKCNGAGTMLHVNFGWVVSTCATCDVCNGRKIISTLTGLPPG